MIMIVRGDIINAGVEVLVNPVNCVGVMGKGLALQFKRAFPGNFRSYEAACRRGVVRPGSMFVYPVGEGNPRYVINFPTKRHWRDGSVIGDIESGLLSLVGEVRGLGVVSVAVPPLGCGLGGLDWCDVRPLIEGAFSALPDARVLLFEPINQTEGRWGKL